jgi:hypothetical protein
MRLGLRVIRRRSTQITWITLVGMESLSHYMAAVIPAPRSGGLGIRRVQRLGDWLAAETWAGSPQDVKKSLPQPHPQPRSYCCPKTERLVMEVAIGNRKLLVTQDKSEN